MTAPFPESGVAGGTSPQQTANEAHGHYVWMARWSDEIGSDVGVDMKKVAQLAIHCRNFARLAGNGVTVQMRAAIQHRFALDGLEWATRPAMLTDLAALRAEALLLFAFIRDNVPEARDAAKTVFDPDDDRGVDTPVVLPKPHIVVPEVAKLRALFG